jgi:hypothetical protein
MSPTTAPMQSSFQSCAISEECYCAPWDLKTEEEKFKLLNEQHQISLSFNHININKPFHRTYSARRSSTKKSFIHRDLSPPVLPRFPPGGLIPSYQGVTNNNTEKFDPSTVRSDTGTSHRFSFASKSPPDTQPRSFEVCVLS